MNLMLALGIGTLTGCGVWLLLRARTFDAVLGLTLISYAVNLFIFVMGRWKVGAPPIVNSATATLADTTDPLPQALVLTAIVISFAMTALLLALALRTHAATGSDHVDGCEPERPASSAHWPWYSPRGASRAGPPKPTACWHWTRSTSTRSHCWWRWASGLTPSCTSRRRT